AELWMLDDDEFLSCSANWRQPGLPEPVTASAGARIAVDTSECILSWVLADHKPCWTRGIATKPGFVERSAHLIDAGVSAAAAFTIRSAGGITGVVVLLGRNSRPPDAAGMQLLIETGLQLGSWLERRRVAEQNSNAEDTLRSFFDDAPFPYHEADHN